MRTMLRLPILCAVIATCLARPGIARQAGGLAAETIACRVLEAHASTSPAVVAVVFHQRDQIDQARLASALRQHSGESVEIETGDGRLASATMVRLKSCFGRGLLLLPPDAPAVKDGATFLLKISARSDEKKS